MNSPVLRRRIFALLLAMSCAMSLSLSVSASITTAQQPAAVSTFAKNAPAGGIITFSDSDFVVTGNDSAVLDSIILKQLPDAQAGVLLLGGAPLAAGEVIAMSAVNQLYFIPLSAPADGSGSFVFTPVFADGQAGEDVSVELYLLSENNAAPVAEELSFTTYKNVAYTGRLAGVDPEGDLITFQLVDKPARGSVTMPEDGSAEFVYTPYENKTGKDSFSYVAVDAVGNTSQPAVVTVKIEKANTRITYADMAGNPAYNAALTLAEEGIYVGAVMDGAYFFRPDTPVSRSEFLTLAMAVTGLEALDGITATGFFDDETIAVWAKPYVSSALKSGVVQGSLTGDGQVVFRGDDTITTAEAAVLLDRLLSVSDVAEESWQGDSSCLPTWASQAAMNLETVGVLQADSSGALPMHEPLTRGDAVQMLCQALRVLQTRENANSVLPW